MRKHITFGTMTTSENSGDGTCATMHNIIAENGSLHTIGTHSETVGDMENDMQLVAAHHGEDYSNLILERHNDDGSCNYYWTDETMSGRNILLTGTMPLNDITARGDFLCMVGDECMMIAQWVGKDNTYHLTRREDLLYDINVSQNKQERVTVAVPITSTIEKMLQSKGQGAEKLMETMGLAIEQARANKGDGCFKHVCLAVAALRLSDGTHIMCSNIFALIPADMTTTITADHENGTISTTTYLHRHTITIEMRNMECLDNGLVAGVDLLISDPLSFADPHNVVVQTDAEGRVTTMTFGQFSRKDTLLAIDKAGFHHAMTLTRQQIGVELAVQDFALDSTSVSLKDFRRTGMGARWAHSHDHRITIGDVAQVMYSPLEIGIRYRFATMSREERLALTPEEREVTLQGEWLGGSRPDIDDNADGKMATVVVRAFTDDANVKEMWWSGQVQYPLPGMMMFPDGHVRELEYHIRMEGDGGGQRFLTTRQQLEAFSNMGAATAIYTPSNLTHRVARPAFLSILLQQSRVLAYDATNGSYTTNYELWEEESEDTFLTHAAKASTSWTMTRQHSLMCTSAKDNPLVFPEESKVTVGDGRITHLMENTRRTADGLFGDGQYYAFTDLGIWVLRLYGGKWQARQVVTRMKLVENCRPVTTNDAVVFVAPRGVMLLKGTKCSCISNDIGTATPIQQELPRIDEILNTEAGIGLAPVDGRAFNPESISQILYDTTNDRLWLLGTTNDRQTWWVYSMKANSWATATTNILNVVGSGDELWAVESSEGVKTVGKLTFKTEGRQPFFIESHPMSLGATHIRKTMQKVIIRGLFTEKEKAGSHIGIAIYGSNDRMHWHLVGTSRSSFFQKHSGTPFAWFKIVTIGRILPSEDIEGVSMEFKTRLDIHIR